MPGYSYQYLNRKTEKFNKKREAQFKAPDVSEPAANFDTHSALTNVMLLLYIQGVAGLNKTQGDVNAASKARSPQKISEGTSGPFANNIQKMVEQRDATARNDYLNQIFNRGKAVFQNNAGEMPVEQSAEPTAFRSSPVTESDTADSGISLRYGENRVVPPLASGMMNGVHHALQTGQDHGASLKSEVGSGSWFGAEAKVRQPRSVFNAGFNKLAERHKPDPIHKMLEDEPVDPSISIEEFEDHLLRALFRSENVDPSRVATEQIEVHIFHSGSMLANHGGRDLNSVKKPVTVTYPLRDIADGTMSNDIYDRAGAGKAVLKFGYEIHWPEAYTDSLKAKLEGGWLKTTLEQNIKNMRHSESYRLSVGGMLRASAFTSLVTHALYLISAENLNIDSEKAYGMLDQVTSLNLKTAKGEVITLPNLFILNGYIFSTNDAFRPVKFDPNKHVLQYSESLKQEVLSGLSKQNADMRRNDPFAKQLTSGPFQQWKYPTLETGQSGKIEDLLLDQLFQNLDDNWDYESSSDSELLLKAGADVAQLIFSLMPVWGGVATKLGMSLKTNIWLGLVGTSTHLFKAAITDSPTEAQNYLEKFTFALAVQLAGVGLSNLKIDVLKNSAKTAAHLMVKQPDKKFQVLRLFFRKLFISGMKNPSNNYLNQLQPGQRLLLARILGATPGNLKKMFAGRRH